MFTNRFPSCRISVSASHFVTFFTTPAAFAINGRFSGWLAGATRRTLSPMTTSCRYSFTKRR